MSVQQEAGHIKYIAALFSRHIQCLHLIYSEVVWVLVSSETPVKPQTILDTDYLPDYLFVSYGYVFMNHPIMFLDQGNRTMSFFSF